LEQCACPNFVIATVNSGPTGPTGPFVVGDQLVGVFDKEFRKCWQLRLPSSIDNSTLTVNFLGNVCPREFNYSYTKPVDPSSDDFSAAGFGRGCKQSH
jgi:hypothetical protein